MMVLAIADVIRLIGQRLDGSPLALFFDIDGTLSPIAPTPTAAIIPADTRAALHSLAGTPDVFVAVVTGRSAADARRMMQLDGVWVVGNHGMEVQAPDGEIVASEAARPFAGAVKQAAENLGHVAETVSGAFVENKGWTVSLHYRQSPRAAVPALVDQAERVASASGLRLLHGKEIVELRPPIDVHKGTACVALAERVGALAAPASILYAGDDRTDEDAFRALRARKPDVVTLRVGAPPPGERTEAEMTVASTDDVRALLEWMLARRLRARARA
jgi:trehalose-phosphatase